MTTAFILMPVEPRDEARWRASTYTDVCFVHAETEHEAREQAARAFAVPGRGGENPWFDSKASVCREAPILGDRPPEGYRGVHFIRDRVRQPG